MLFIIQRAGLAPCRWCPLNSHVRPHESNMLHILLIQGLALLVPIAGVSEAIAQPRVPDNSLYAPKPSQDLSWAYGDWVAKGEHPVLGDIAEWRVKVSPGGVFIAELYKSEGSEVSIEQGKWIAIDREIWSFVTFERNRHPLPLPVQDLYNILVISQSALELRHMKSGKVLRLERASA